MIFAYVVIGIVLLYFLLSSMGPKDYAVERSTTIARTRNDIYDYIRLIKNQNEWGPWIKKDSDVLLTYTGDDGEVGFVSAWNGKKDVGQGEQEITRLVVNERVESDLRFLKPFKSESNAFINLEDAGENATKVTWGFSGENKTSLMRVMGLFMNMDKAVGKDFEAGMRNLKEIMEK